MAVLLENLAFYAVVNRSLASLSRIALILQLPPQFLLLLRV
jgi:hypothetical protein